MEYPEHHVLIVSRLDYAIRTVLEDEGGIAPGRITEVKSVDDAVEALDELAAKGIGVGAIIYYLDIVKDRDVQFWLLMQNVRARQQPLPVIVMSMYNSSERVQTRDGQVKQPVISVAGALTNEGVYAHLPIDAPPKILSGWVKSALEDYATNIRRSGSQ